MVDYKYTIIASTYIGEGLFNNWNIGSKFTHYQDAKVVVDTLNKNSTKTVYTIVKL